MKYSEYEELKQHGSPDFPIQHYFVDPSFPRYIMPLHWHNEFEMIYIRQGKLKIFLNNIEYTANEGDVLFISGGTLHRAVPFTGCIYECVVFDLKMLCKHSAGVIREKIMPILSGITEIERIIRIGDSPNILEAVCRLCSCLQSEEAGYELEVYSIIFSILYLIHVEGRLHSPEKDDCTPRRRQTIITLIAWIEKNYAEKITLSHLAKISDINEKYLCRFFREFTGYTPTDYVNRLRIERACFEISVNGKSVTEAALDCGFCDMSYFSKTFKKYKGISPKEFKKT